jgi:hypothetical protein
MSQSIGHVKGLPQAKRASRPETRLGAELDVSCQARDMISQPNCPATL